MLYRGGVRRGGAAYAQETPDADAPSWSGWRSWATSTCSAETLLFYISTKAGDRYDERRLEEDFRRLWDTGFLDDLLLDVRDGPAGKVVSSGCRSGSASRSWTTGAARR